jgi:hypothetical protein
VLLLLLLLLPLVLLLLLPLVLLLLLPLVLLLLLLLLLLLPLLLTLLLMLMMLYHLDSICLVLQVLYWAPSEMLWSPIATLTWQDDDGVLRIVTALRTRQLRQASYS